MKNWENSGKLGQLWNSEKVKKKTEIKFFHLASGGWKVIFQCNSRMKNGKMCVYCVGSTFFTSQFCCIKIILREWALLKCSKWFEYFYCEGIAGDLLGYFFFRFFLSELNLLFGLLLNSMISRINGREWSFMRFFGFIGFYGV